MGRRPRAVMGIHLVSNACNMGHPPHACDAVPVDLRRARPEARIAPVTTRKLVFSDRADGAVVIRDMDSGATAAVIAAGEKTGFIRGVMRGFARDRRARGLGEAPPFALTLWRNGQLSLTDTATDRSVELTAFGAANRAAFAALLKGSVR